MKREDSTTGQKAALVALVFVGIITLGLGFYKVQSQIAGPFKAQISRAQGDQLNAFFDAQKKEEDVQAQKSRDTDGDGLSDYDELNIHRTSPYLKDTDSDGYDDKTEVSSGNDPTCAKDKVCFVASASNTPGTAVIPSGARDPGAISAMEADLKKLESLTPAQVRELLKQQGFTEADLKDVDDATLINLYRESLQKAIELEKQKKESGTGERGQAQILQSQKLSQTPTEQAANLSQEQISQELANLTKPQIIQMLTETGQLSGDQLVQLQKLDETQLKQIFYTALQNAETNYDAKRQ